MSTYRRSFFTIPFLTVIIVFIVDISFITYTHTSWNNTMEKFPPLSSELASTRNDISEAHLWLEEAIGGDQYIDINEQVLSKFKHERFTHFTNTLHGRIDNQKIIGRFNQIDKDLDALNTLALQRWNNSVKYTIGSDIDQLFDKKFLALLSSIDSLIVDIKSQLQTELSKRNTHFMFILSTLILLNIAIVIILFRLKKAEDEHRVEIEEFQTIFHHAHDGIALIDIKGKFLECNLSFINLLGYSKEQIISRMSQDFIIDDDKEEYEEAIKFALHHEYKENFEIEYLTNSVQKPVNISISKLPNRNRLVLIVKDISSLKNYEERAKLASMGEMIGNIAHQWRQPLSVISTSASGLCLEYELKGDIQKDRVLSSLKYILNQANYLSKTIDNFRGYFKPNKEYLEVSACELVDNVKELVDATLKNNFIQLKLDLDKEAKILCNINELSEVFINIINNAKDAFVAQDHLDEKIIILCVKQIDNSVVFEIKDNAGGIDHELVGRIFEPYFTTKHKSIGTGLGLTIVNKIITEKYNGEISVANESFSFNGMIQKGACFKIVLQNKS